MFDFGKEEKLELKQLLSICRDVSLYFDQIYMNKDTWLKNSTSKVRSIIDSLGKLKQEDEKAFQKQMNGYIDYLEMDEKNQNDVKNLLQICEMDPSWKDKVISKYKNGKAVPVERYAVEYIFEQDKKEQLDQKKEENIISVRDYFTDKGKSVITTMCVFGKYVRENTEYKDGIIPQEQKENVKNQFSMYMKANLDELASLTTKVATDAVIATTFGEIAEFENKWVKPTMTNLTVEEFIGEEEYNDGKNPYQKK